MGMFRTLLIVTMVSAMGCAGSQPARMQLPPDARVGILNVLEPQMTHVDVGTLRFDSFTKPYKVDWDLPGHLNRTIQNDLKARGGYTFIPLAVDADAGWKQSTSNGIVSAVNSWLPGDLKAFLEKSSAEHRLDVIVSVSSYDSGTWQQDACFEIGKSAVVTKGYGLFTRTRPLSAFSSLLPVAQDTATPYANIIVAVFQTRPAALAAYGQAPCSKSTLADFPWKSDLQFLGPAVLQQLRPYVERLSAEAVRAGLGNAGLSP